MILPFFSREVREERKNHFNGEGKLGAPGHHAGLFDQVAAAIAIFNEDA